MALPLMPKATAVWLVDNSTLGFGQIGEFCGLHELEVQAIADDEVAVGMHGMDPVANGELTAEEIERCQKDPAAHLNPAEPSVELPKQKSKGARYTPVSKRQDRPDAIFWLLKNYPELSDAQISKLVGTTKPTINAVRTKTHWNSTNIKAQNPVGLGLCTGADLEKMVVIARGRAERAAKKAAREAAKEAAKKAAAAEEAAAAEAAAAPAAPAEPEAEPEAAPEAAASGTEETPSSAPENAPAAGTAPAPEESPETAVTCTPESAEPSSH